MTDYYNKESAIEFVREYAGAAAEELAEAKLLQYMANWCPDGMISKNVMINIATDAVEDLEV